jgi:hypothetical protein
LTACAALAFIGQILYTRRQLAAHAVAIIGDLINRGKKNKHRPTVSTANGSAGGLEPLGTPSSVAIQMSLSGRTNGWLAAEPPGVSASWRSSGSVSQSESASPPLSALEALRLPPPSPRLSSAGDGATPVYTDERNMLSPARQHLSSRTGRRYMAFSTASGSASREPSRLSGETSVATTSSSSSGGGRPRATHALVIMMRRREQAAREASSAQAARAAASAPPAPSPPEPPEQLPVPRRSSIALPGHVERRLSLDASGAGGGLGVASAALDEVEPKRRTLPPLPAGHRRGQLGTPLAILSLVQGVQPATTDAAAEAPFADALVASSARGATDAAATLEHAPAEAGSAADDSGLQMS